VLALLAALAVLLAPMAGATLVASEQAPGETEDLADPAAALRVARAAVERGDSDRAKELLRVVERQHPIVGDYAALLRGRLLLDEGDASGAAGSMLEALAEHADSRLRSDLYRLLGDARATLGDEEGARAAWSAAVEATRDGERRASLRLSIARSLERAGDLAQAGDVYRTLWIFHAGSDGGRIAAERLPEIEAELGRSLREPSDWRRRGDQLLRDRANEEALAAYDHALAAGLEGAEERRARVQRAHTLFRLRRYDEALKSFSSLPQEADVAFWRARSLARSGDVPAAVRAFEHLAKETRGATGVRALYLAALLLEDEGQAARAKSYYQRVGATRHSLGLAGAAIWRLGWQAYREERWADAVARFEELIADDEDPIDRLRPRYWRARALGRLGDARALDELAAISREFPLSYYGWRARELLDGASPQPGRLEIDPGRAQLRPSELARPRILLEAGMRQEAGEELASLAGRARGLHDRLELAQLFTDAGDFNGAQRVVVDAYTEPLARGPQPQLEELWWYAWPTAYADLVSAAATGASADLECELVYSIMREESGYRPAVVSVSGARGLLQIMAGTGERLSRELGRGEFSADELFEPSTNISLGAYYLAQLSHKFQGRLSAAVAGYNAGPTAVSRWLRSESGRDDDEWVESIPYDQTRSYVKRVLRSLHAYRVLY
jgi:soluble lytic murein transglycosylase